MKRFCLFITTLLSVIIFILSCDTATEEKSTETADYNYVYEQEFQQGCLPSSAYIGGMDTYIASSLIIGYPASASLLAGRADKNGLMFSLLKFNLTTIPKQAKVQKAVLVLYRNASIMSALSLTVDFLEIIKYDWDETVNYDLWKTNGGMGRNAGTLTIPSSDTVKAYNISLNTAVVQNWIEKPEENFGLLLGINIATTDNYIDFASCEGPLPNRPILAVYYTF